MNGRFRELPMVDAASVMGRRRNVRLWAASQSPLPTLSGPLAVPMHVFGKD